MSDYERGYWAGQKSNEEELQELRAELEKAKAEMDEWNKQIYNLAEKYIEHAQKRKECVDEGAMKIAKFHEGCMQMALQFFEQTMYLHKLGSPSHALAKHKEDKYISEYELKLSKAIDLADKAMMKVVNILHKNGDIRWRKLSELQAKFCAELQYELEDK